MSRACCFTGHRALPPTRDFAYAALTESLARAIDEAIDERDCTSFYTGGAIGFDLIAAELMLRRKERDLRLSLTVCVPYCGHDAHFSPEDRARWAAVREQADQTLYLSDRYAPACFWNRNRYMVDHSDLLIAYVRDPKSGSGQTYALAKERGLDIILL